MKTEEELKECKFTEEGIKRYNNTINDYSEKLFSTAIALGHSDQEITQTHVRDATIRLSTKIKSKSTDIIILQSFEYIFTALVGVSAGHIPKTWAVILFGISIALGVICFVTRTVKEN